mmetsp:Transcript_12562/g.18976  ORF Transcript_12562/g.18976 Transcript_12562/m.18976 type:complete len:152 (+) Transcript_12562:50-505(+)
MDLSRYLNKINDEIKKTPIINKYALILHDKTHISPEVYVLAIGGLLSLMIFFNIYAGLICNIVGVVYPLYQSIKVIEMKRKDEDKQWLMYWVVYSLICCFEAFIDVITYWVPFYYPLKVTFLVWCMHPTYKGATVVHSYFLQDFVSKFLFI